MQEIHALPGRIRLRDYRLKYERKLAGYLNVYIDNLYGVKHSHVSHITACILIVYDMRKTNAGLLKGNICKVFKAVKDKGSTDAGYMKYDEYHETLVRLNKAKRSCILFGLLYAALKLKRSLYGQFWLGGNTGILAAASVITIISGYPMLKKLYNKYTRKIHLDSDVLLYLAALAFTLARESTKGILVLLLKSVNDYIKYSADAQCQRLLCQSLGSGAGMAWLKISPLQESLVPAEKLRTDDTVIIHNGEMVPADSVVTDGEAVVNSLYCTGRPVITTVGRGSRLDEGLSVVSGEITIRVEKLPRLSAQRDSKVEDLLVRKRVERHQGLMTPLSLGAGLLSFIISGDVMRSLALLLALSPSAAATAYSSGLKSYTALLNKHGIFLKDPGMIEKLAGTRHIVFDKTGTLTHGIMKIISVTSYDSRYTQKELLRICAACETCNYHPISLTLRDEAGDTIDMTRVQNSVLLPSKGIIASYDGMSVIFGNRRLMKENGIDISSAAQEFAEGSKTPYTPVFIAIDGKLSGVIVLHDVLRKGAYAMISSLKQMGYHISMLTGDVEGSAGPIAEELGISSVYSCCSYSDKEKVILGLKKDGPVIMTGDGVNDADAMKSADLSASFADSSCDRIKIKSDIVIFDDRMQRFADMFRLTGRAYDTINQTISFAQAYNIFWGVLAFTGRLDAFAAKSVNTLNSLLVLLLNKRTEYYRITG